MKYTLPLITLFIPLYLLAQNPIALEFEHDGLAREYLLYVPADYTPGDVLPLVFNFHGITSSAGEQYIYTGLLGSMNTVADTGHFFVCYPNGVKIPDDDGFEWNVGFAFSSTTADDVGFVERLIDTLHANYGIDQNRVYATGMSNGGYFAYRLACELSGRIQAVASVTGTIVPGEETQCRPERPVPVLQLHGTADPVVRFNGSQSGLSMDDLIKFWTDNNRCFTSDQDVFNFPNINTVDGSTVSKTTYTNCQGDNEVVFYRVEGGEHTWPGSSLTELGVTNQDIVASREIWEFFRPYSGPIVTSTEDIPQASFALQVQPNPFVDQIQLNTKTEAIQTIIVSDLLGRTVYQNHSLRTPQHQIPTTDWTPGLYLLRVETVSGAVSVQKIIKS